MLRPAVSGVLIALQLLLAACSPLQTALAPRAAGDLVTLIATNAPGDPCSPVAFPNNFAFATRIDRAGVSTPFAVPAGKVLVVTGFSWVAVGPPNATATVELRAGSAAPLVRASALCDAIIGRCGGSVMLPTGAVIGAGVPVCLTRSGTTSLTIEYGSLQGYLAPQ
jgi:hypothetical protein